MTKAQAQRKAVDMLHDVAFQVVAMNAHADMVRALRLALPILESAARAERIRNRLMVARDCTSEHALNAAQAALAKASA